MMLSDVADAMWWSCQPDSERLSCETVQEAVEEWNDQLEEGDLPETLTVYAWRPMALPAPDKIAERVLEYVYEMLDDEYGDPDGCYPPTVPVPLSDAAMVFAAAVREHYKVFMCERAGEITVRAADYVEASA